MGTGEGRAEPPPNRTLMLIVCLLALLLLLWGIPSLILTIQNKQGLAALVAAPPPVAVNVTELPLGGDFEGTTANGHLILIPGAIPGTFPVNGSCIPQVTYLNDGRSVVIEPCEPIVLPPTGWPAGAACPVGGNYFVTNIVTNAGGAILMVECTLANATIMNGTAACGDLTGFYPCPRLTNLISNPGCINLTVGEGEDPLPFNPSPFRAHGYE